MAYNNYFPVNYGYQPQQPAQSNSRMTWVQGEAGAKSYLVGPNETVPLWDSEAQTIYIKSADTSGMPSMKILDYTIRDNSNIPPKTPLSDPVEEYVTKKEMDAFKAEISAKIDSLMKESKDE